MKNWISKRARRRGKKLNDPSNFILAIHTVSTGSGSFFSADFPRPNSDSLAPPAPSSSSLLLRRDVNLRDIKEGENLDRFDF